MRSVKSRPAAPPQDHKNFSGVFCRAFASQVLAPTPSRPENTQVLGNRRVSPLEGIAATQTRPLMRCADCRARGSRRRRTPHGRPYLSHGTSPRTRCASALGQSPPFANLYRKLHCIRADRPLKSHGFSIRVLGYNKRVISVARYVILHLHSGMGESPMKRAVLYLRVSTVDQTTPNQDRELSEVAGRNPEGGEEWSKCLTRRAVKEPDHWHGLLPACRKRPLGRAAEKGDEFPPSQVEHAASSPGATAIIRPPPAVLAQSV